MMAAADGVSVDHSKVQSIVEWATSCSEALRFTRLANYYRRFVEGYAELAAPLTALFQPHGAVCMDSGDAGELRRS